MTCAHCQTREGTEVWADDGGALAYVHGFTQAWCKHCVLEAQLAYCRQMAARIPTLEVELAVYP
jgi:hypothetical protein